MVPYVNAVVDVTVIRVLLFVLHVCVCMLRKCESARVTEIVLFKMCMCLTLGGMGGEGVSG